MSRAVFIFGLGGPNRRNSDEADVLGYVRVDVDVGPLRNLAKEGPGVANVELVFFVNFNDLVSVEATADVLLKEWLQGEAQHFVPIAVEALERHEHNVLQRLGPIDFMRQFNGSLCSHFAKVKGCARRDVKLRVSNLEVALSLQNSNAQLEKGHEQLFEQHAKVNMVTVVRFEVTQNGFLTDKQKHAFQLVHATIR